MSKALKVLIVEDSPDDAALVLRELRRGEYDPVWERVETAEAMNAALERAEWDVILSDYTMPNFSAFQALETLKSKQLDIPFIIISGTIGEETAVLALKAGAQDYLIKGRLARLVPALEREIREAIAAWNASLRRPRIGSSKSSSTRRKKWRRWAGWPGDWRTTSTIS